MAETKMAVEKEIGLFAHICRQRNGQQKYSRIVVKKALPSAKEYRASN